VNGTDASTTGAAITALTRAGTLLFAGWILWLFTVLQRVTQVGETRVATVWEQRLETLVFLAFPSNIALIMATGAAAAAATWLAGPTQSLGLAILLRSVRWTCNGLAVVAIVSIIVEVNSQPGGSDTFGTVSFRAGGALALLGTSMVCHAAGRTAPGG
jgi:hypothetical protein